MSRRVKYLVFVLFVVLFLFGVGQVGAFSDSNVSENTSKENYIVKGQENINEGHNIKESLKIGEREFFLVEDRSIRPMDFEPNDNISEVVPHRILTQSNFSQNREFKVLSDTTDDVRGNIRKLGKYLS